MEKLKYEIPGMLFALSLLMMSSTIENTVVRYIVLVISILGIVVLAYIVTKVIQENIEMSMENRKSEIKRMITDLTVAMESYSNSQDRNTEKLIHVVNDLKDTTSCYIDRVDSLVQIQNSIIEEEKVLNGEIRSLKDDIHKILDTFCTDFSKIQEKANKNEMENLLKIKDAVEEILKEYKEILNESKESMNALKAQVKVSLDKTNTIIQDHASQVEDRIEDCEDEIGNKLEDFSREQKKRDEIQNTKINEAIESINNVIENQINQALSENRKLLDYIQKVQNEWTSLSRDEIAFLDKVWNE